MPAAYTQHPRPAYYKGKPEAMGKVVAGELYDHDSDANESRNVVAPPPDVGAWQEAVQLLEQEFPRRGYD